MARVERKIAGVLLGSARGGGQIATNVEVIFVDDGSPDAALQQANLAARQRRPIFGISAFARNFGHHKSDDDRPGAPHGDLVFPESTQAWKEDPALPRAVLWPDSTRRRRSIWFARPRAAARRLVNFRTENPLSGRPPCCVTLRFMKILSPCG